MCKKSSFIFISFLLILTLYSSAFAENIKTTKPGYLASLSETMLEKAIDYAVANDKIALQKLLDSNLVFILKEGIRVYIVDVKLFSGTVKIRPVGETFEVWTVTEAVSK